MADFIESLTATVSTPILRAALNLGFAILTAALVRFAIFPILLSLAKKTHFTFDDEFIRAFRAPTINTIIIIGIGTMVDTVDLGEQSRFVVVGLLKTFVIIVWTVALTRVGGLFLEAMSPFKDKLIWIQPSTLPLLNISWRVLVIGGMIYFLFLTWHINPTSWIASAGVAGIAIGFAAKDTLANLFAGIFILTDAPFKIGDFVVLDNNLRGMVTDIGIRSARILTRDDVEVSVPNAIIANAMIVNEAGGPYQRMRIRLSVFVAYGSDVDLVRQTLLESVKGMERVASSPAPRVRFREFGDSGLRFELLAWVQRPVYRGWVMDKLYDTVYKEFNALGIEIPYAKQDIYIKELPSRSGPTDSDDSGQKMD